jgi:hypothetical protein
MRMILFSEDMSNFMLPLCSSFSCADIRTVMQLLDYKEVCYEDTRARRHTIIGSY